MPLESAKIFGLISILLPITVVALMLVLWPHSKGQSISRHSAQGSLSFYLMALMQTVAFPMFLWFSYKWFAPTFGLSWAYLVCVTVIIAGFLLAAWVPDVEGIKRKIHELSAYSAAWLMIPASLMLVVTSSLPFVARLMAAAAAVFMSACVLMFYFVPKARDYHLPLQSIYIVSYFAVILLATYVR